jgi:hypothetical protein
MARDLFQEAGLEVEKEKGGPRDLFAESGIQAGTKESRRDAVYQDTVKKRGWGSGANEATYDLGGKVTDLTGSPAAGGVANFIGNAVPAFLTSASPAGPTASSFPGVDKLSRWLMQTSVKPNVAQYSPKQIDDGMRTMLNKNIYGSPGGMNKAMGLSQALDDKVGQTLANSPANVSVPAIMDRVRDPLQKAEMQFVPQHDVKAVEDAWTLALQSPHLYGKSEIPVKLAHDLKKGTYSSLGKKVWGEVGSSSTEAQKAMARGARETVADAVPAVREPLKEQASLQNVLSMAGPKASSSGNLNPFGLSPIAAGNPKMMALMMADRWAALKEFLAMQAYHGAKPGSLNALGLGGNASEDVRQTPEKLRGLYP